MKLNRVCESTCYVNGLGDLLCGTATGCSFSARFSACAQYTGKKIRRQEPDRSIDAIREVWENVMLCKAVLKPDKWKVFSVIMEMTEVE